MEDELERAVKSITQVPLDLEKSFSLPTAPPPHEEDPDVAPTRRSILEKLLDDLRCTPSPPPGPPDQLSSRVIDLTIPSIKEEPEAAQRSYITPPRPTLRSPPARSYTPPAKREVVLPRVRNQSPLTGKKASRSPEPRTGLHRERSPRTSPRQSDTRRPRSCRGHISRSRSGVAIVSDDPVHGWTIPAGTSSDEISPSRRRRGGTGSDEGDEADNRGPIGDRYGRLHPGPGLLKAPGTPTPLPSVAPKIDPSTSRAKNIPEIPAVLTRMHSNSTTTATPPA